MTSEIVSLLLHHHPGLLLPSPPMDEETTAARRIAAMPASALTHLVRWSLSNSIRHTAQIGSLPTCSIQVAEQEHDSYELLLLFDVKKKIIFFFSLLLLLFHTIKSGCLQSVSDQRFFYAFVVCL